MHRHKVQLTQIIAGLLPLSNLKQVPPTLLVSTSSRHDNIQYWPGIINVLSEFAPSLGHFVSSFLERPRYTLPNRFLIHKRTGGRGSAPAREAMVSGKDAVAIATQFAATNHSSVLNIVLILINHPITELAPNSPMEEIMFPRDFAISLSRPPLQTIFTAPPFTLLSLVLFFSDHSRQGAMFCIRYRLCVSR